MEENYKIIWWYLPASTSSTKWKRTIVKRYQRRVDIKKDMDELHKYLSNRRTSAQEWKTTQRSIDTVKMKTAVFDSGVTSNCEMVGDYFILTEEI